MAASASVPVAGGSTARWRLAGLGCALLLIAAFIAVYLPMGPDWPAQDFRAWVAAHDGLATWTNQWYSGTALAGYSLAYPIVGAAVGAAAVGAVSVVVAWFGAVGFTQSMPRPRQIAMQLSVAFALLCDLLIGQIPFLLGVAFGVWAIRAARVRKPWWAAAAAVMCSCASPLVGAFLLLSVPALSSALDRRRVAPLCAAIVDVGLAPFLGGAGGPFPFVAKSLVWIALYVVALTLLTRQRSARLLGLSYGVATLACFAVANPVAGNICRLGQLTALPLLCLLHQHLRVRRAVATVILAVLGVLWTGWPALGGVARGAGDASRHAAYYSGLLHFLHGQSPNTGRLEVVFTREHWESLFVARAYPIARGWERQTDLAVNHTLYAPLTPATYRAWLAQNAISLVALPDAPIDFGGRAEAALLAHAPPYLTPVWHDRHWRVWRVDDPTPIVSGAASMEDLDATSLTVRFARAGRALVRIRSSSLWDASGRGVCIGSTRDGWTTVTASHPGPVTMWSEFGLSAPTQRSATRCRP